MNPIIRRRGLGWPSRWFNFGLCMAEPLPKPRNLTAISQNPDPSSMALKRHAAPQFFGFCVRPARVRPDGPQALPVLRADHARARPSILSIDPAYAWRLFRARRPKRCRQASERGPGGFRMGRAQPHGIVEHHEPAPAPIFNTTPGWAWQDGSSFPSLRPKNLGLPRQRTLAGIWSCPS